jgi:hypothetical protein
VEQRRIPFADLPWSRLAPGAREKAVAAGSATLRLLELSADFTEEDWCLNAHHGLVIQGEIEIDFGGSATLYQQGDGIHIPGGFANRHKATPLTDKVLLFLVEEDTGPH